MPLNIHTGRAGSGKSYNVVENVILKSLEKGRNVITNIPVVVEEFEGEPERFKGSLYQFDIDNLPFDFFDEDKIHKGAVYIFDEAQKLWPSGLNVDKFPQSQKRFLSEHRHYVDDNGDCIQIVVISQDASLLARYVRVLCDYTFIYKKLSAVGQSNAYNGYIYEGAVFEDEANSKTPVNTILGKYKKDIYKYYKSHTKSDNTILGANESGNDSRTTVFSNWRIKYGIPLAILLLIVSGFQVKSFFSGETLGVDTKEQQQQNTTTTLAPAFSSSPAASEPSHFSIDLVDPLWRITYYDLGGKVRITNNVDVFYLDFKESCEFHKFYGVICKLQNNFIIQKQGPLTNEKDNSSPFN